MKKLALAVAACFVATCAGAATVQLYGRVNLGLAMTHTTTTGSSSQNNIALTSGDASGSRWGLRGEEDLGAGWTVGFDLENGFSADTGTSSRLFHRESSLRISSPYGTLYAGRLNSLTSDSGSIGWYGAMVSPFGTGWGDIYGHTAVTTSPARRDNTIAYMSPVCHGFQLSAQYSMGDTNENKPSDDRYAAIGLSFSQGNLDLGAVVDYLNKNSTKELGDEDDAYSINLGGAYNFGIAKVFLAGQYYDNAREIGGVNDNDRIAEKLGDAVMDEINDFGSLKGYAANIGADIPLCGGSLMLSVGYADADAQYHNKKVGTLKSLTALGGYQYSLSKRTWVYGGVGYTRHKLKIDGVETKDAVTQVLTGIVHSF